jgi:predicted metal-dependent enzyme (double-stranded beta helix superfamily)
MAPRIDPCDLARHLAPALHWPGAGAVREREWRLIAHTEAFDAWLIAWPPGGTVTLHDHGPSQGALSVIAGTLVEAVPWRDDTGRLALRRKEVAVGTTLGFRAGHVHDVTNESETHAFSLHVYAPALTEMTLFELRANRLVTRGVRPADGADQRASGAAALR